MAAETSTTDLEDRVERIEKHLNKRNWLDEPATDAEGNPYTMSDTFPLPIKIAFCAIILCGASIFVWMLYVKVMS